MALNYPGPYQVRIGYSVQPTGQTLITHSMQLNCNLAAEPDVGDLFSTMNAIARDGSNVVLSTAVDDLIADLVPLYEDGGVSNFSTAELWKYEPNSFEANYVSTYDISELGTGVAGTPAANLGIFTFRTQEGGIMRFHIHEAAHSVGASDYPPLSSANLTTLANGFLSNDNIWLARDTSYPIALIAFHPSQSEKTFKRRYRT